MKRFKTRFHMMGTFIDLEIHHPNGVQLIQDSYLQLHQYEQRFTVNQPDSELMRVNQNAGVKPVTVPPDMYHLIKKAKAVSDDLRNPFNIAIGPLVKAWRIGFKDARVPTKGEIAEKISLVDPQKITLNDNNHSVYLSQPGMEIDLGAIAKGYFADQIKQYFLDAGVEHGIINLGGNVLTIGHSPENTTKAWHVGIQNPQSSRGETCRVVLLRCASMVTSGINERFFQANGQHYHHLLNSQTGQPISTDIASVTIISKHSVEGEIWSTAGFLCSVEASISYLNQQTNIEAVVISKQGDLHCTLGLEDNGRLILQP